MSQSKTSGRSVGDVRRGADVSESRSSRQPDELSGGADSLPNALWQGSGLLFGVMVVWSVLQPHDSVAVFQGDALPQVLGWLATGVLTSVAAWMTGRTYRMPVWLTALLWLMLGWLVLVTVLAGSEVNPRVAWYGFWQVMGLASCFFAAKSLLVGARSRAAVLGLCLVGIYGSSWLGGYQVLVENPALRQAYSENPELVLRQAGIDAPLGSIVRQQFENRLRSPEPHAAFSLANSLAVLLSCGLIVGLGLSVGAWSAGAWSTGDRGRESGGAIHRLRLISLLLGTLLIGWVWFLTLSRTAYLAVGCGLLVWGAEAWMRSGDRRGAARWIAGGAAAAVLVAVVGVVWLLANDRVVLSEAPKSLAFRLEYWWATTWMLMDYGWRGVGLGNFQDYYPRYMLPTASETIADPHNWLFDMAASLSIPIAVACTVWLGRICLRWGGQPLAPGATQGERSVPGEVSGSLIRGGVVGVVLCVLLLGLLAGYRLDVYLACWVLAGGMVWLQFGYLRCQVESPAVLRGALASVLVCLLASGSWQAAGIAVPLLLLVVCLEQSMGGESLLGRQGSGWLGVVLPTVGLLCFVWQCWMPVTRSWAELAQVSEVTPMRERLALARQAAEADPLDTEPLRFLSSLLVAQAGEERGELFRRKASEARGQLQAWLERDSVSHMNWAFAGDRSLELAARAQRVDVEPQADLVFARDCYREAVARYPTSVMRRVQLAAVLAIMGDELGAREEIDEAWRLSDITPHTDKKLETQQIWLPFDVAELEPFVEGEQRAVWEASGFVAAEPVGRWIRRASE